MNTPLWLIGGSVVVVAIAFILIIKNEIRKDREFMKEIEKEIEENKK